MYPERVIYRHWESFFRKLLNFQHWEWPEWRDCYLSVEEISLVPSRRLNFNQVCYSGGQFNSDGKLELWHLESMALLTAKVCGVI